MEKTVGVLIFAVCITIIGRFDQLRSVKAENSQLPPMSDDGGVAVDSPLIEWPTDEVVVGFGETWNITCTSNNPIVWKPFDAEYNWDPPNIKVSIHNTTDIKMPYGSMLTMTNASALMVGRYYCVHSEKQHEDPDEMIAENVASSIYVYVKDPHQLIVPLPVKYYYKNHRMVILCKPAHPEVDVELCDQSYKSCKATSDPTKGFLTLETAYIRSEDYYCKVNDTEYAPILPLQLSGVLLETLKKPIITSNVGDQVPIGRTVRLTCSLEKYDKKMQIKWITLPNHQLAEMDNTISIGNKIGPTSESSVVSRDLIIENATMAHKRTYRCEVFDSENNTYYHNFKLHVRESTDDFIELSTAHNRTNIRRWLNKNGDTTPIEIIIHYKSYPPNITYEWFKDYDGKIDMTNVAVFKEEKTEEYIKLIIHQPKSYNTDIYTVVVQAGTAEAMYNMSVFVHDKPTLTMDNRKAAEGDLVTFQCTAEAYPVSTVSFMFQSCKDVPRRNCSPLNSEEAEWQEGIENGGYVVWVGALYEIYAREPGIMYCKANNSEGNAMTQAYLLIENVSDFMTLEIVEPKGLITVGDNVIFVCSVMIFVDTVDVTFERNGKKLEGTVIQNDEKMHKVQLTLLDVGLNHTGEIFCNATYHKNRRPKEATSIHMEVIDAVAPQLRSGKNNQTLIVDVLKPIKLECDVGGIPEPKTTWFKDGKPFEYNMSSPENTSSITIENANPLHSGLYKCFAENKKGNITLNRNVTVRIPDSKWNQPIVYVVVPLVLLIAIAIGLTSLYFFYKKKKQLSKLEDGIFAYYNPVIPQNEETKLPFTYKSQYEFPLERLKLLTQLGTGAFGVVMKAIATGIKVNEETTIVAVKIVKDKHDDDSMRALLSELKILTNLGRHLNVVNLLGAVTKNISNHELMVIVEYCAFGNLQDYLQKHRGRFMDQISHQSDEILQSDRTDCVYQYNIHGLKYVSLSFSTDNLNHTAQCGQQTTGNKRYGYSSGSNEVCTNVREAHNTSIEKLTAQDHLSFNSDEPLKPFSHAANNPVAPLRSLNTTDLIIWAAQVASGMEYLASQKVMHGDLAARNILLCDDNVVKICDFGLARTIYRHNVYKKNGEALLPFKWVAIECITDNIFNTQSDVWAYGIVLWELFSLGKMPYPGLDANLELYNMLQEGYRMQKPRFANRDIYDIMLNCWAENPNARPSFTDLRRRFNAMMPEEVLDRLLKLNEPYVALNAANKKDNDAITSSSFDPLEVLLSSNKGYVNVTKPPALPSSDIVQSLPNDEPESEKDAEGSTISNSGEDVEEIPQSLEAEDSHNEQIYETHMTKQQPNSGVELQQAEDSPRNTSAGISKMNYNRNAELIVNMHNAFANPCYIEMKQFNEER